MSLFCLFEDVDQVDATQQSVVNGCSASSADSYVVQSKLTDRTAYTINHDEMEERSEEEVAGGEEKRS